jgi:hypothetical protein
MIPERYFMWSICLPVVAPLVLFAVNIASAVFLGMRPAVGTVGAIVIYSGIGGGIPYLLFACVLAWKLRHAPLGRLRVVSLYAPLVFAPFVVTFVTAMGFVQLGSDKPFTTALYLAGWAVGVGYAYVGTVHLGFFVLRRLGAFKVA